MVAADTIHVFAALIEGPWMCVDGAENSSDDPPVVILPHHGRSRRWQLRSRDGFGLKNLSKKPKYVWELSADRNRPCYWFYVGDAVSLSTTPPSPSKLQ